LFKIKTMKNILLIMLSVHFLMSVSAQDIQTGQIIWQNENLSTRTFSNSDEIYFAENIDDWSMASKQQIPAWCFYNFDPSTEAQYGIFYNTYAINDERNLAPNGWIIPTEEMLRKQLKYFQEFQGLGQIFSDKNKVLNCNSCKNYALLNNDGFFERDGICLGMKDKKYLTITSKGLIQMNGYGNWGGGFQIRCVKLDEAYKGETIKIEIPTLSIDGITWMTKNLRAKTFQNGDSIKFVSNSDDWVSVNKENIPAYCFKDFDSFNEYEHGFYYNYAAIKDARKLAPKGWRINSKKDWESIQKKYADTMSFVQAIVSDNYYPNANNSLGLNLLPESKVNLYGMFTGVSLIWCPSSDFKTNAIYYTLDSELSDGTTFYHKKEDYTSGLPVRCVKE
jgi:uncharacterized protein (TIGR02145 family)